MRSRVGCRLHLTLSFFMLPLAAFCQVNWSQQSLAASPEARSDATMVYDSVHQQVVLFGGFNEFPLVNLGDTWLWQGTSWTQQTPANSPSARSGHAMAYDVAHQQAVLFGGQVGDGLTTVTSTFADTWVWDGNNWTQKTPANSPPARWGHTMAYDAAHQQVVLFGGQSSTDITAGSLTDTWVWDGTNWTQKTPITSPYFSFSPQMAYDSVRQQVVLYDAASTWLWDGANWNEVATVGVPSVRLHSTMAWDSDQQKLLLFGGYNTSALGTLEYLSETWAWDGATWTQLAPASLPPGRSDQAMAYDDSQQAMVVFGGEVLSTTAIQLFNDTWILTDQQPSTALRFVPVTPCRVADTRNPNGAFGGPILSAGTSRQFVVPESACGIPSTAQAYALNVTAVPSSWLGYLTVWPTGQPLPAVSTLNSDGRVKAVAAIPAAGTNGSISVYATNDTHVVLDINGYFVPATDASALAFYPMTPCRALDTRISGQGPALASGVARTVNLNGAGSACTVPANAQAYSLNFTVVPAAGLGYLSAWPSGESQPLVSTLNATHAVTSNAAIIPAGNNSSISVYASDATHLIVDMNGYFAAPASNGLSLYTTSACRAIDTRTSTLYRGPFIGALAFNMLTGGCSVPASAQAYVLNTTVVPTDGLGYLTLWADGQGQPLVSTLNSDGSVNSNLAIVPTQNGKIDAYASDFTQLIFDLSGYFAP